MTIPHCSKKVQLFIDDETIDEIESKYGVHIIDANLVIFSAFQFGAHRATCVQCAGCVWVGPSGGNAYLLLSTSSWKEPHLYIRLDDRTLPGKEGRKLSLPGQTSSIQWTTCNTLEVWDQAAVSIHSLTSYENPAVNSKVCFLTRVLKL